MKTLITGNSSSGKTTVIEALKKRGFNAYNADDYSRLEVRSTSEPTEWPDGFVDWSYYAWNWSKPKLTEILTSAEDIFIGGIAHNQKDFYSLLDHIIILTINMNELKRRMLTRPDHPIHPTNLERMIQNYPKRIAEFVSRGAIPVDNSGDLETTVDNILEAIHFER